MSEIIFQRKQFYFNYLGGASTTSNLQIFLGFIPDEMRLLQYAYSGDPITSASAYDTTVMPAAIYNNFPAPAASAYFAVQNGVMYFVDSTLIDGDVLFVFPSTASSVSFTDRKWSLKTKQLENGTWTFRIGSFANTQVNNVNADSYNQGNLAFLIEFVQFGKYVNGQLTSLDSNNSKK